MCSVWTKLYVQVMCITWISRTLDAPVQFSVTKMCTTAARGKSYIFVFSWLQMFHNECAWLTTCDSINDEIDVKHSHTQTHTRAYSLARSIAYTMRFWKPKCSQQMYPWKRILMICTVFELTDLKLIAFTWQAQNRFNEIRGIA